MEQEPIDVTRATPATATGAPRPPRRGTPLWLQLVLSLLVIAVAIYGAAFFIPSVATTLRHAGINLPGLPVADAEAQPATQAAGQTAGGRGGQAGQAGGGQGRGQASRAAVVVAATVTTGTINNKLTAIGDSSAIQAVTVNSAQGGTLLTVDVKPGDQVAAGAELATLDSGTQQIAYDRAKLASEDADATLARTALLAKSNSVSSAQLATVQLAADQAKLAVNDAKLNLDQRTITTPVAGTVGLIQVTPGNLINAQTVVTTIEDASKILINFYVPERYSSKIAIGAAIKAESAALPGQNFTGTISAVDNKIDPASRTLQVQATLPNDKAVIKAGMSFSVEMDFPGDTFASVDPLSVQWSNTGAYVWKIVDEKAQKGMVEIIQRNSDGVLVNGDVKAGDQIVTQGVLQLSDGLPVRLFGQSPVAAPGGKAAPAAPAASAPASTASSAQG